MSDQDEKATEEEFHEISTHPSIALNNQQNQDIEMGIVGTTSKPDLGNVNYGFEKDYEVQVKTEEKIINGNSPPLERTQKLKAFFREYKNFINISMLFACIILYIIYFGFAIHLSWSKSDSWCHGAKFLTIITICVGLSVFYFIVFKRRFGKKLSKFARFPFANNRIVVKIRSSKHLGRICFIVLMLIILLYVIIDSNGQKERLISYGGLWVILIFGFVFSKSPGKVIFRHVVWGIGLQFVFALLILRWNVGKDIFSCLGDKVATFLSFTQEGSNFMFNYLASGKMNNGNLTMDQLVVDGITHNATAINIILPHQISIFAFTVLPVVLFFSFCVAILYYYGIMQWIVMKIGWLLEISIGTSAAESMNAAGNIFMGQSEAPLLIKPYLSLMTKSELHAIMTGGFATIAGSVLAAYISLGISASHLLTASVMSAPAALGFSKLFYPETEISKTTVSDIRIEKGKERNALEAASVGVSQAVGLVATIAANLIAFIAFIYFVDNIIMWFGSQVGWDFLSMTYIMSQVFRPLAFVMGVPWDECEVVGELIGLKTIVNEFVAYDRLVTKKSELSNRSQIIATYALCGFSNLSSIGIQLGGLGSMAPQRISDLAEVAFRAMVAGSAACFLTACIAGALMKNDE